MPPPEHLISAARVFEYALREMHPGYVWSVSVSDEPAPNRPEQNATPEPLLTICEIVDRYRRSERWFRYRIGEGMPSHKWGSSYRFRASEIEAWMEERNGIQ